MSENNSKIIYNFNNGLYGTAEYNKNTDELKIFDDKGKEYESEEVRFGFYHLKKAGFPETYIYAYC